MKSIILILISLLFSVGGDSIKFKFDPSKYSKNLKLNNIIPTNNENNILSKEHLLPYQIDELKQQAKEYTPIPVTSDDIVIMETTRGTMKIELYNDIAPKHCYNFKKLANSGFYDGTYFHRIIKSFMIQGGDILSRDSDIFNDGTGNPGWQVDAEFNDIKHEKGVLSMARGRDVNSAGSQFFICSADAFHLDRQYTAFGKVIENEHVISLLENTETDRTKALRSCSNTPPKEDLENWVSVNDPRSRKILYSKIPEDYSKDNYIITLKKELQSDRPISAPKIKKVRVVGRREINNEK